MTVVNKTGERLVGYEFTWNGDRIERIVTLTSEYTLDYDEEGRLSRFETKDYDAQKDTFVCTPLKEVG